MYALASILARREPREDLEPVFGARSPPPVPPNWRQILASLRAARIESGGGRRCLRAREDVPVLVHSAQSTVHS
jgi:hypothetical protein